MPINETFNKLWGWSDPINCHPNTYLNDPWACNFITFTNCTDRIKSSNIDSLFFAPTYPNGGSSDFLTNPVTIGGAGGITQILRNTFDDSPYLSQDDWLRTRLYAFLDRPNAQLRNLLRKNFQNIKPIYDVVDGIQIDSKFIKRAAVLKTKQVIDYSKYVMLNENVLIF